MRSTEAAFAPPREPRAPPRAPSCSRVDWLASGAARETVNSRAELLARGGFTRERASGLTRSLARERGFHERARSLARSREGVSRAREWFRELVRDPSRARQGPFTSCGQSVCRGQSVEPTFLL